MSDPEALFNFLESRQLVETSDKLREELKGFRSKGSQLAIPGELVDKAQTLPTTSPETEATLQNFMNKLVSSRLKTQSSQSQREDITMLSKVSAFRKAVKNNDRIEELLRNDLQRKHQHHEDDVEVDLRGMEQKYLISEDSFSKDPVIQDKPKNFVKENKEPEKGKIEDPLEGSMGAHIDDDAPHFGGSSSIGNYREDVADQIMKENKLAQKQEISAVSDDRSPSIGEIFRPTEEKKQTTQRGVEKQLEKDKQPNIEEHVNQESDRRREKVPSDIDISELEDASSIIDPEIFKAQGLNEPDDYPDDDDPGFDAYEVYEQDFAVSSRKLADKFGYPDKAVKLMTEKEKEREKEKQRERERERAKKEGKDDSMAALKKLDDAKKDKNKEKKKDDEQNYSFGEDDHLKAIKQSEVEAKEERERIRKEIEEEGKAVKGETESGHPKCSMLPQELKFVVENDGFYPKEFDNVIYDTFTLKVVYDREKTGFEETKDFPIVINSIIAGRYQVIEYLGSAAFSKAIHCRDIYTDDDICLKIIENNKDFFDQSLDEIKLLRYINNNGDSEEHHVLRFYDFFYHKEHLFLPTELLKDNLYDVSKYNRENEDELYFTVGRLQKIARQALTALDYIHSLHLIHCDLKPENILIKSYSRCEIKVIDFGSSCFIHDHLSSYVQSRSYRAPEVILGAKYDYRIDIWSLGCILAELWTGNVLFQNDTIQGMLSRIMSILGPFPEKLFRGKLVGNFFTKEKLAYQFADEDGHSRNESDSYMSQSMRGKRQRNPDEPRRIQILVPKKTALRHRLRTEDPYFYDFIKSLLDLDWERRPTAKEALQHPWLQQKYEIN